ADKYLASKPSDAYTLLMKHLIRLAKHEPDDGVLKKRIDDITDQQNWFKLMGQHLFGQLSESQILAIAKSHPAAKQQAELLDFYYYTGEFALARGDKSEALRRFQSVVQLNFRDYAEYWNSVARVRQLSVH